MCREKNAIIDVLVCITDDLYINFDKQTTSNIENFIYNIYSRLHKVIEVLEDIII